MRRRRLDQNRLLRGLTLFSVVGESIAKRTGVGSDGSQ